MAGKLASSLSTQLIPGEAPSVANGGAVRMSVLVDGGDDPASRLFTAPITTAGSAAAFDPLPAAVRGALPPGEPVVVQFLSLDFSPYPDPEVR